MEIVRCPWLPEINEAVDFNHTRRHGAERGAEFYRDALVYAQSQWLAGKPAQAILQLNKAWMADLVVNDPVLISHPSPYRALGWILQQAAAGAPGFFGNPVRHFQHLASRMSGPRKEVRSWRAWACFYLSERILPHELRDGEQLCREGLSVPTFHLALTKIAELGWNGEVEEIHSAFEMK